MCLYVWNVTVSADGDAGKQDGVSHAAGNDHGLCSDEKHPAVWDVQFSCQPHGGGSNGSGFRGIDSYALHSGDDGTLDAGGAYGFDWE